MPGWYFENSGREYPFLRDRVAREDISSSYLESLKNEVIVDFGCTMGVESGYVEGTHSVYLYKIEKTGDVLRFEFRCDAPPLLDKSLFFCRAVDSDRFAIEYSSAIDNELASESSEDPVTPCGNASDWFGFLVTGDLSSLASITSLLAQTADDYVKVEPANIDSEYRSYVSSINLANADRTRATTPEECIGYNWPFEIAPIYVNKRCLTGTVLLKEGYNCQIDVENNDTVVIGGYVGRGAGEPCEEVKLFDSEEPHDNGTVLTGGPACDEVLRAINGIGGKLINITSDTGARVTTVPNESTIILDFNMSGLSVCDNTSEVSEECDEVSEDSDCGSI